MKNLFWSADTSIKKKKKKKLLIKSISGNKRETSLEFHDPEKVTFNFSSYTLWDSEKGLLSINFRFALLPTKIDFADFLVQFELLCRNILEFILPSEKRDPLNLNNKLKHLCFSTLNCYNFGKVHTNLTESKCKFLKELIQCKELVIQKADKGNTVVITDRENYVKGIESLLSGNSKFKPLNIDKDKWLNYSVNLEKKLKEHFKTSKNNKKI